MESTNQSKTLFLTIARVLILVFALAGPESFAHQKTTEQIDQSKPTYSSNDNRDWQFQSMRRTSMVATGNSAPDFKLPTSDRRSFVRLSSLRGKPVVLIFGSCTSPQFKTNADLIRSLHHEFKSVAQFLFVYIREVGAESRNVAGGEVKDAATIQERSDQAERTHRSLRIDMTCVVDDMDDPVTKTYSAWPERLCIIDKSGKIAVLSQPGPKGFHPTVKAVRNWLSSTR